MTTLVTGATGLVGNNVVRLLLERGEQVRVLIRQESLPAALEGLEVEVVRGDVCDSDSLEPGVSRRRACHTRGRPRAHRLAPG